MSSFFHTLVVVGAGLSLANCAGKSQGADHAGGNGNGGNGNAGTSGASAGGATGGMSTGGSGGTGGTLSIGGTFSSGGAGGSLSFGGAPWGGMAGMPTTQWSCDAQRVGCGTVILGGQFADAVSLDGPCPVDPSRPVSPAECAAGEGFQCTLAELEEETVLVDCACSVSGPFCDCRAAIAVCIGDANEPCAEVVTLCGCAVTCIAI